MNCLGRQAKEGESPVIEIVRELVGILSRTGHVESCLNLGRPLSKAKYSLPTDSEQVPWGKDEKNPDKGSEIEFETVYLQTARELL